METVLLTSGYVPRLLDEARARWHVIDIHAQREALAQLQAMDELPAAVCVGLVQPKGDDLSAADMLAAIHEIDPALPVIVSTGTEATEKVVELVKRGAFDYVVEPADRDDDAQVDRYVQRLMLALDRAVRWRSVVRENQQLKRDRISEAMPPSILARSRAMLEVMGLVEKVAPTGATVLVTGESGTGKELIARAIHDGSPTAEQPFTAVNCGALSPELLSSELFGHVRGSFTGADADRDGLIRRAGKGTLFLDEIGTVQPAFQVMLLRVLDQRVARAVGASQEYPVQCRIIAAANRDLRAMVDSGAFREDFYYRLNLFHIHVPPLRDREDDVPVLAHHFLREAARQYNKPVAGFEPAAMNLLEQSDWPGNIRQLRNTVERAVILCDGDRIGVGDLDPQVRTAARIDTQPPQQGDYQELMTQFERRLLQAALTRAKGNLSEAARSLNMKRTTLNYRLKRLDLP